MSERQHRWSGFPGAYCLDCGADFWLESAICCAACYVPCCDEDMATDPVTRLCPEHGAWRDGTATCPGPRTEVADV